MGNELKTLPFDQVLEEEIQGWNKFRRAYLLGISPGSISEYSISFQKIQCSPN